MDYKGGGLLECMDYKGGGLLESTDSLRESLVFYSRGFVPVPHDNWGC